MARNAKTASIPTTPAARLSSVIKSSRDIMRKDAGLNGDLDRIPEFSWILFLKAFDDLEQRREITENNYKPAIRNPFRWRDWAADPDKGMTGDELLKYVNDELFPHLRGLVGTNGERDQRAVIAEVFKETFTRFRSGYLLRDVVNLVNGINFNTADDIHTMAHLYESMLKEMRDSAGDSGEFYTPRPVIRFIVQMVQPKLGDTIFDPACGTGGFLVEAHELLKHQVKSKQDRDKLQYHSLRGVEKKPMAYLLGMMNLLLHEIDRPNLSRSNALIRPLHEIGDKDRVDIIVTNPPFGGEEEKGIQLNFPEATRCSETALLFLQLIMRALKKGGRCGMVVPESVMSDKGVAARIRQQLVEDFNLHTVVRLPKGVFEPYSDIQTNLLFFDRTGRTANTWFYEHTVPATRQEMQNPCYTRSIPLRYDELQPIVAWWPRREPSRYAWNVPADAIAAAEYSFDFRNPHRQSSLSASPKETLASFEKPLQECADLMSQLKAAQKTLSRVEPSKWEKKPLSALLTLARTEARLEEGETYKQITVRLYGKGAVLRKTLLGREIRTRPQFLARAGQLIMSRIDARNGAFAIVPAELDQGVVSQDFPVFDVNRDVVEAEFLPVLLRSHGFLDACKRASRGTTNRKRLKEVVLLAEVVPVPDKPVQQAIADYVKLLRLLNSEVDLLKETADNSISNLANFLFG